MRTITAVVALTSLLSTTMANPVTSTQDSNHGVQNVHDVAPVIAHPVDNHPAGKSSGEQADPGKEEPNALNHQTFENTGSQNLPSEGEEQLLPYFDFPNLFLQPMECTKELSKELSQEFSQDVLSDTYSLTYMINECMKRCNWAPECTSFTFGKAIPENLMKHCMIFSQKPEEIQEKYPQLHVINRDSCGRRPKLADFWDLDENVFGGYKGEPELENVQGHNDDKSNVENTHEKPTKSQTHSFGGSLTQSAVPQASQAIGAH